MGWKPIDHNPFDDGFDFDDLLKEKGQAEGMSSQPDLRAERAGPTGQQASRYAADYNPFSAMGATADAAPSALTPPAPQAPQRPQGLGALVDPQQYKEVAKGVPGGAVSFVGTALQGAAAVPANAQANMLKNAQAQIDMLDRLDRGEKLSPKKFGDLTGMASLSDDYGYAALSPEQRRAQRAKLQEQVETYRPTPLAEQPIYQAGEKVKDYAKTILPAAPGYEDAVGRQLGEGLGSLVAGLGAGLAGRAPALLAFTSAGSGEAGSRAIEFDKKERAAGRPGLSQDEINTAALWGVGPGATDLLPVETLLGRLRVPLPLQKPLARAIGRIGGQAFIEGVQEGGQAYLQNLIAREGYNPEQKLTEGVAGEAAVGGGVGGIAQTVKELGGLMLRGLTGRRAPAPQPQPQQPAADPFAQPVQEAESGVGVSFDDLIPAEPGQAPVAEGQPPLADPAPQALPPVSERGPELQSPPAAAATPEAPAPDSSRVAEVAPAPTGPELPEAAAPARRGVSVLQFIRSKGGLKPSRELMGLDARRYPGLINRGGLDADKMREAMVEAGYLTEANPDGVATTTPQDVFDLVARSISGERIVPGEDRDADDAYWGNHLARNEQRELQAAEQNFIWPEIDRYDRQMGSPAFRVAYNSLAPDIRMEVIDRNRRGEDIADLLEEVTTRDEAYYALGAPLREARERRDSLGYTSKALDAVAALKQNRGIPQQMLAQLESAGVKNSEIEAIGLDRFILGDELAGQRRRVLALRNQVNALKNELNNSKQPLAPERVAEIQQSLPAVEASLGQEERAFSAAARGATKPLAKQDILEFLEHNRVQLSETTYGSDLGARIADELAKGMKRSWFSVGPLTSSEDAGRKHTIDQFRSGRYVPSVALSMQDVRESLSPGLIEDIKSSRDAKWREYSLDPSNPTYRESVIGLGPSSRIRELEEQSKAAEDEFKALELKSSLQGGRLSGQDAERYRFLGDETGRLRLRIRDENASAFTSGHWSEPNVVAHIRTGIYTDTKGRRVFLLDELQSDWGQKIRDGGARDEEKIADLRKRLGEAEQKQIDAFYQGKEFLKQYKPEHAEIPQNPLGMNSILDQYVGLARQANRNGEDVWAALRLSEWLEATQKDINLLRAELRTAEAATPAHPLVNTTDQWVTTAMRRVIQMAADADADGIAVTPGKVQAQRFGLGSVLNSASVWLLNTNGVPTGGRQVTLHGSGANPNIGLRVDDNGIVTYADEGIDGAVGQPLSAVIGQRGADAVMNAPHRAQLGLDQIDVGGEGMKATYDGLYPSVLGKLLKKLDSGVKAEKTKLMPLDETSRTAPGTYAAPGLQRFNHDFTFFPLTEKAKAKLEDEGQPMFALGAPSRAATERDALNYYSKALEEARALKQNKGTGEQMLAQLEKAGVKASEIEATGLDRFLLGEVAEQRRRILETRNEVNALKNELSNGKPSAERSAQIRATLPAAQAALAEQERAFASAMKGESRSVTKDEIVDHLRQNRASLKENTYGGVDSDNLSREQRQAYEEMELESLQDDAYGTIENEDEDGNTYWTWGLYGEESSIAGQYSDEEDAREALIDELRSNIEQMSDRELYERHGGGLDGMAPDEFLSGEAQWNDYSLEPGNPTYRERVLYLDEPDSFGVFVGDERVMQESFASAEEAREAARARGLQGKASVRQLNKFKQGYQSSHWDEPNIVAHMRSAMYKDDVGRDVFLLDELQSDWGQALREGGARDEEKIAALGERWSDAQAKFFEAEREAKAVYDAHEALLSPKLGEPQPWGTRMGVRPEDAGSANWHGYLLVEGVTETPFKIGGSIDGWIEHWPQTYIRDEPQGPAFIVHVYNPQLSIQGGRAPTMEGALALIEQQFNREPLRLRLNMLTRVAADAGNFDAGRAAATTLNTFDRARQAENLARAEFEGAKNNDTTPHPLVNTTDQWVTTALRRVIQHAVNSGADGIAITPGKVQAKRFDLSRAVDKISVWLPDGGQRQASFYSPAGVQVGLLEVGEDGIVTSGTGQLEAAKGSPLAAVVGKEIAQEIMAAKNGARLNIAERDVGGEGMKATYDGIYPRTLGKLLQKMDPSIKMEKTKLRPSDYNPGARIPLEILVKGTPFVEDFAFFPITRAVKDRLAGEGQPMFAIGGDQTKTPAFKRWFGDSKVTGYGGEPLRVYHATLSDFEAFNRGRANPESDMGAGFYFTDAEEDAASNYAHEGGPDIRNRIDQVADQLLGDDEFLAGIDEQNEGLTPHDDGWVNERDRAREAAKAQLGMNHEGMTMPVYLSIKNPVIIGESQRYSRPDETFFDYQSGETYNEELDDYEYGEPSGKLAEFIEAFRDAASEFDVYDGDVDTLVGEIMEEVYDEGLSAGDLIDRIKKSEAMVDASDYDGRLVRPEIVRHAFEKMGFDGIIDHTPYNKWGRGGARFGGGMDGVNPDTTHYIAFKPNQIKSAIGNRGTFDPADDRITYAQGKSAAEMKRHIGAMLKLGRAITIPHTDAVLEEARRSSASVPSDAVVAALHRIEPVKGQPGRVKAIFKSSTGDVFTGMEGSWENLAEVRAFFNPGNLRSKRGVFLIRFTESGGLGARLGGEVRHESIHALRRSDLIPAQVWSRLVGHAKKLRILEADLRDYLRAIGDPDYRIVEPGLKLIDEYLHTYKGLSDIRERIEQEYVAHMAELYSHGKLDLSEVGDVGQDLEDIFSGRYSGAGSKEVSLGGRRAAPDRAFAGPWAKTAKQNTLLLAQMMAQKGKTPQYIWKHTGWFEGADGRWRFEIDDSAAEFLLPNERLGDETLRAYRLGNILRHDELFRAYPNLKNIIVYLDPNTNAGEGGHAGPSDVSEEDKARHPEGLISLGIKGFKSGDRDRMASTLLHEIQHGIQAMEGFASGSSIARSRASFGERWNAGRLTEVDEDILSLPPIQQTIKNMQLLENSLNKEPQRVEIAQALNYMRNRFFDQVGYQLYHSVAGEVEARLVQSRQGMSSGERRNGFPEGDVPASGQIVNFRYGTAMADDWQQSVPEGRFNERGFELLLPYKERWGDPRFNPEDRQRALARIAEIAQLDPVTAPYDQLAAGREDLRQIASQMLYFDASADIARLLEAVDEVGAYGLDHWLSSRNDSRNSRPSIYDQSAPDDIQDISSAGRSVLDRWLAARDKRRGLDVFIMHGEVPEPRRPRAAQNDPTRIGEARGGFYFKAARTLPNIPDGVFQQGGQAVINALQQAGVRKAEIDHLQLDQLANQKPASRDAFAQKIADRIFAFRRKTSWFNPESNRGDYEAGGTRAFSGPRIPGRGIYFERLMAFPKKLKGGEPFAPGHFESPHWESVLPGTWASWRGSMRDVPGWGRMVIGEEGQTDFMQGATARDALGSIRRPRMKPEDYLKEKAERGAAPKATPESPLDDNYVRTMVRDLLLQAAQKGADSVAISTSATTARIQNSPRAAHFYDHQLKPALQAELRRITGDGSLALEEVALPKPMGGRKEKPYTVWAARIPAGVNEMIADEGQPMFALGARPDPDFDPRRYRDEIMEIAERDYGPDAQVEITSEGAFVTTPDGVIDSMKATQALKKANQALLEFQATLVEKYGSMADFAEKGEKAEKDRLKALQDKRQSAARDRKLEREPLDLSEIFADRRDAPPPPGVDPKAWANLLREEQRMAFERGVSFDDLVPQ